MGRHSGDRWRRRLDPRVQGPVAETGPHPLDTQEAGTRIQVGVPERDMWASGACMARGAVAGTRPLQSAPEPAVETPEENSSLDRATLTCRSRTRQYAHVHKCVSPSIHAQVVHSSPTLRTGFSVGRGAQNKPVSSTFTAMRSSSPKGSRYVFGVPISVVHRKMVHDPGKRTCCADQAESNRLGRACMNKAPHVDVHTKHTPRHAREAAHAMQHSVRCVHRASVWICSTCAGSDK